VTAKKGPYAPPCGKNKKTGAADVLRGLSFLIREASPGRKKPRGCKPVFTKERAA